jgi:hypothetical protein
LGEPRDWRGKERTNFFHEIQASYRRTTCTKKKRKEYMHHKSNSY